MICGAAVRGGGVCMLDAQHRGHHSTVVFRCDGCGKRRRGTPHQQTWDGEEYTMAFCFLCCLEHDEWAASVGWDG
jgi:hypothetical protein